MSRRFALALLLPALLVGGWAVADDVKKDIASVKAPAFELQDSEGKTHKLDDYKGKIVVLEWTNQQCPIVVRHYKDRAMAKLAEKYIEKGVVWLAVDSSNFTSAEHVKPWKSEKKISYPILLDASGTVGKAYGAKRTPEMVVIKDGRILYQGAIDDDQRGNKESATNYVAQALDEIMAGKPVSVSKTKSYGCNVKYGRPAS